MQATAATASEVEAAVAYEKKVSSPNLTKRIEKDRKGTKWDKCSSRRLASEPLSFSIRTRLYSTLFCTHRHCRVPHLHESMQPSWPPFSFWRTAWSSCTWQHDIDPNASDTNCKGNAVETVVKLKNMRKTVSIRSPEVYQSVGKCFVPSNFFMHQAHFFKAMSRSSGRFQVAPMIWAQFRVVTVVVRNVTKSCSIAVTLLSCIKLQKRWKYWTLCNWFPSLPQGLFQLFWTLFLASSHKWTKKAIGMFQQAVKLEVQELARSVLWEGNQPNHDSIEGPFLIPVVTSITPGRYCLKRPNRQGKKWTCWKCLKQRWMGIAALPGFLLAPSGQNDGLLDTFLHILTHFDNV